MSKPLILTTHARQAMQMRRVSMDEVLKVISSPETTDKDREGNKRYFRDKLCVVTRDGFHNITVKTVLFRYGDTWTDKDVRAR